MFAFRKTTLAAFAALLSTTALPACAQPAPEQKTPEVAANDADPALWVVKDKDTTVYLFGTVHVLKPGLSWFDEAVKTAFDGSQTLVLEMVEPDPATMQQLIMAKGMAAPGTAPLAEQIPADKRDAYAKAVAATGLPPVALDKMKPWMAAMMITMIPLQKMGYDPNSGAEKVLGSAAKTGNKEVKGLETMEEQLGFFDNLSQPAQVAYLASTAEEAPKMGETMGTMIADWAKGDPESLGKLINENLKDSPEVAKALLTDRNARWAGWIAERMKQPGQVFVAVGAGHLAGEGSVQQALGKYKLTAERVKY